MNDPAPRPAVEGAVSRAAALVFGVVLLFGTAVSGLFGLLPIVTAIRGTGDAGSQVVMVLVGMPLFVSMAVVLGGATWSLMRYGFTGRGASLLSRTSLTVFGVVLTALIVVATVGVFISGDVSLLGGAIEGALLVVLMWRVVRARRARGA